MRLRRAIDNAVGSRAFVLRFLRGKVRGGRFGFPHSVGCSIPYVIKRCCWPDQHGFLRRASCEYLARLFMLAMWTRCLFRWPGGFRVPRLFALAAIFGLNARPQGIHKVDGIRSRRLFWPFDLFALGLLFNQFAQGVFVLI